MFDTYQRLFTAGEYVPTVSTDESGFICVLYTKGDKHIKFILDKEDLKQLEIYNTITEYVRMRWDND